MSKKSTKGALLASGISLLLCFTMLLGTTFAWFTDSVSTTNNIITAGNLDVKLYHRQATGDIWNEVDADTNVFKTNTLWEPGHAEVVNLKIENAGTLALKYQLGINIAAETASTNVAGEQFKLSDYIKYAVVDGAQTYDNSAAAAAAAETAGAQKLNYAYSSAVTDLLKSGENYVTVIVYMPTSVGNEANYAKGAALPKINLGINLAATQFTKEDDSFGNQYDAPAIVPDVTAFSAADLKDALENAEAGKTTVIALADDIEEDIVLTHKADTSVVIDGNGKTISGKLVLDGQSGTILSAGATIRNVKFVADSISGDAFINLGDGTNDTRYVCNVTVENCTFDGENIVGIKSYTGGDKNLVIRNCTTTARTHSLAQLKNVDGILVENCTINSVRGINFNNSNNIKIVNSKFDVQKYAVRFGADANTTAESYEIVDCTLSSQNVGNDPVIEIRAGAMTNSTLKLTNTTLNGNLKMTGYENVNIIEN